MAATNMRTRWIVAVVAAIAVGWLTGSWTTATAKWSPFGKSELVPVWMSSSAGAQVGREVSFANGFEPVARQVLPAVVNIASSKTVRSPALGPSGPFQNDPFFEQFFGRDFQQELRTPRERREHSLGSGVVVSPDGYILTNHHVVNGATDIRVSLPDRRELNARLIGTDPKTDIAVLKVQASSLPVLTLGDSSKMRVGDFAVAVGNPFGVGQTMTMGIVSATGRGGFGIEDYEDFLQTDAAVNPGNSGGALVNVNGELIGINTAIVSGTGGSQGVGFAVPVNMARNVMDQILKTGKVTRGYLGVTVQPVREGMAKAFGLTGQSRGALISDVAENSPAARAGLSKGDILLELNGDPLTDSRDLSLKTAAMAPGAVVRLKTFRDGKERMVSATLGDFPAAKETSESEAVPETDSGPRLGISVETLTPEIKRQLDLPSSTTGIVINDVQPGSRAQEAGLQRGDVIEEINRKPATSVDEFKSTVQRAGNDAILLLVMRPGGPGSNHIYVLVEPKTRNG